MDNTNKKSWKKDLKDTLEMLAIAAVSAGIAFHVHYACTRHSTETTDPATGHTIATQKDTAAVRDLTRARTAVLRAAPDTLRQR